MTNNNLTNFIKEKIALNDSEIFFEVYENKRYWIKKARETKSTNTHKFFYFIFKIDILLPVKYKSAQESIIFETNKIKRLTSFGINMPKIIYQDQNHFVLEDCGETINSYIRQQNLIEDKFYYYINKTIQHLANIHNKNEYHGGAQTRNFTYKNGDIYTIDFEESFDKNISIKTLQFRDLMLLILSLTKVKVNFKIDYKLIILNYIKLTNNNEFIEKLHEFINQLSFFIKLSKINFIYKKMGSDLKSFFNLIEILKTVDVK